MERDWVISDISLIRKIGKGAYGEVWLCKDVLGDYQAAKIIPRLENCPHKISEKEWKGLERYQSLSRESNELLTIFRVGKNPDFFYYLMELADPADPDAPPMNQGYRPKTLKDVISKQGKLPKRECLKIASQLTENLKNFHHNELIHRDIKPSNIVFVGGKAKMADIGLVRHIDEANSIAGTTGYMAPEGALTPQSDFYSLGLLFYRMMTGNQISVFPELSINENTNKVDRDWMLQFNTIISKCTHPIPSKRYKSAEDILSDLNYLNQNKSLKLRHKIKDAGHTLLSKHTVISVLSTLVFSLVLFICLFRPDKNSKESGDPENLKWIRIPSQNWDFGSGTLEHWHLFQWPTNMMVLPDPTSKGGYYYCVNEWEKGASITTPKFLVQEKCNLYVRYKRSGPSSCEVFVASGSDKKRIRLLASNDEVPSDDFVTRTFPLNDLYGMEVYVGVSGGSVSIDYMYVEQFAKTNIPNQSLNIDGQLDNNHLRRDNAANFSIFSSKHSLPIWLLDKIVLFYSFNGSATDISGNNIHGTSYNVSSTKDRFGNTGSAAVFNGSDSEIRIKNADLLLGLTDQITVTMWINCHSFNLLSDNINQTMVIIESPTNLSTDPFGGFSTYLYPDSKSDYSYRIWNHISKPFGMARSKNPLKQFKWHWLAWTVNGQDMNLYIDGEWSELLYSQKGGITHSSGSDEHYYSIGSHSQSWPSDPSQPFSGILDDLAIYSTCFNKKQIKELYALEKQVSAGTK